MSDSLDKPAAPEPASSEAQLLFVDEADTPTLFHESGKPIAETHGCSRWALQRFYEVNWDARTGKKSIDPASGSVIREDRFLKAMWPQVGEVHDLHFGRSHGAFFTAREPLTLERRFPPPPGKKKKP